MAQNFTTHENFRALARKYAPSTLLPVLARLTIAQSSIPKAIDRWPYPWLTSALARDCIAYSNEHRSHEQVTDKFLRQVHNTGLNLYDPIIKEIGTDGALESWILRTAYQQVPFNEFNPYAELGHLLGVFGGGDERYRSLDTKVISEQAWIDLLGMPFEAFVRAAFVIIATALGQGGRFNPEEMDPRALSLTKLSKDNVTRLFHDFMATGVAEVKDQVLRDKNKNPGLHHLNPNPLVAKPFVDLGEGQYVAPISDFAWYRMSLFALYFEGRRRFGGQFSTDVGRLVEDYVGQQLDQLEHEVFLGEQPYGKKGGSRTCDWVLAIGGITLIIEVKTASMAHAAKLDYREHIESINRDIGKALKTQIPATAKLIREGHQVFAPYSLPDEIYGMVVTADRFYTVNSEHFRSLLPDPGVPFTVMSLQELDWFIAAVLAGVDPHDLLRQLSSADIHPEPVMTAAAKEAGIDLRAQTNPLLNGHVDALFDGLLPGDAQQLLEGLTEPGRTGENQS